MTSQATALSEELSTVAVSQPEHGNAHKSCSPTEIAGAPTTTADHLPRKAVEVKRDSSPPAKLNLKKLVPLLCQELESEDAGSRQEHIYRTCKQLLEGYDATSGDWKRYQTWDSSKSYTRNLIYEREGVFALILLCWNPNVVSPVHDHSSSECFFRVVEGTTYEELYEWPEKATDDAGKGLKLKGRTEFPEGEVSFVNDSQGIHRVGCCNDKRAVTLHCYVPGYATSTCWKAPESADDTFTGHMVYDTVNGKRLAHSK